VPLTIRNSPIAVADNDHSLPRCSEAQRGFSRCAYRTVFIRVFDRTRGYGRPSDRAAAAKSCALAGEKRSCGRMGELNQ
jgi:hypothetical protein